MLMKSDARYTTVVVPNQYFPNRTELRTDVQAFARDLAKTLGGGALIPPNKDSYEKENFASFMLGNDLISVSGNSYQAKGKVTVRISAPDVKHEDRNTYAKDQRTSDASVNPEARSIESIAKDIKKRVIDPSQEALKLQREYQKQRDMSRLGIAKHIDTLTKAGFAARRHSERDLTASVGSGCNGFYVDGTVNADGTVSIRHLASMSIEKFIKVMKVLNDDPRRVSRAS